MDGLLTVSQSFIYYFSRDGTDLLCIIDWTESLGTG
jgi:hypothetical protein